jgi:putative aldouronate transport system substrate-binding protein
MKKLVKLSLLIFALVALLAFAACADDQADTTPPVDTGQQGTGQDTGQQGGQQETGQQNGGGQTVVQPRPPGPVQDIVTAGDPRLAAHGLELVAIDGEDILRFTNTRSISVLAWNRSPDRLPNIRDSYWADYIRAEMLRLHNVEVDFVQVPRWGPEYTYLAALLAADMAPDVAFTFQYPTVLTFAEMGGVMDLAPLTANYRGFMPNFYDLLGEANIYWNRDPQMGTVWAFAGRHFDHLLRINTFVREDWLQRLNIAPPTTLQEFEDMLIAFRDNASLLLGDDAHQMIPFRLTQDAGWTGDPIITSFIPNDITDRQWYVYGFDDRRFMMPGIMEGVRVLNRWFNEGLIWQDFSLHDAADPRGDELIMLGFVGAFSANWDYPFRASPGIITNLRQHGDPDGNFIVVTPFQNDAGIVRMQVPHGTDRSIFFPRTNTEPIASLLYLDWISRPETREFLMFGIEGVHHIRHDNGAFEALPLDDVPDHQYIPVIRNFDILPTFNGMALECDTARAATQALGFPGIPQQQVIDAIEAGLAHAWVGPRAVTRAIAAESDFGGGLPALRDAALNTAITAPIDQFDTVFNAQMSAYMAAGGRAIIEERRQAWIETFGDVDWLPLP